MSDASETQYEHPTIYIQQIPGNHTITGVATSVTAFVGRAASGPVNQPTAIGGWADFEQLFGGLTRGAPLGYAVRDFFQNGGAQAVIVRLTARGAGDASAGPPLSEADYLGSASVRTGLYALDNCDLFNLLVIPPDAWPQAPAWMTSVYQAAATYCLQRRAFLIMDPPAEWAAAYAQVGASGIHITDLGGYGPEGESAAVYFPGLLETDPLQDGATFTMAPSGAIAGIYARTDAAVGVWRAPAGIANGGLSGVQGLELNLSDTDDGLLNPQRINVLRSFPVYGPVVWGARTLKGADALGDDYRYVPVRRLALYVEESLYRGTQWVAFEPNNAALWTLLGQAVSSFMNQLYLQGAFMGASASEGYFVTCDATTTTPQDVANGVVNVLVGFAPTLPAEFITLTITQPAGAGSPTN